MGEDVQTNNKSTVPVLVSQLFDTEPDWNEMEFLIKWKGQSHLHCQWKTLSDLQNVRPLDSFFNFNFDQCIAYILDNANFYCFFTYVVCSYSLVDSRRFLTIQRK